MSKTCRLVTFLILLAIASLGTPLIEAQEVAQDTIVTAKQLPPAKDTSYQWKFMALAGAVVVLTGLGLLLLIKKQVNVHDQK